MKRAAVFSDPNEKSTLKGRLLFFFFPPKCALCGETGVFPLCEACREEVEKAFSPERFLAYGGNGYADEIHALFPYKSVAKHLVWQWKVRDLPDFYYLFRPFIQKWYEKQTKRPAVVTFVPRRQAEKRKNGFDQAERLASAVEAALGIPTEKLLLRHGRCKVQHKLPREKRHGNVFGIFRATKALDGETVLLVDDIVTSGASCKECCRILKKAGAQRVVVLSLTH